MPRRRLAAMVAALVLTAGLAADAVAQRSEWVLLGEKAVGFRVDRDAIDIPHGEDWYRDHAFRRLHLIAERNDIHLLAIRLVYFNGYAEDYRVDRRIGEGQDQPIDLRGDRRFLRRVELIYRSRPSFEGRAVMKVYGVPARFARRDVLPPIGTGGGGTGGGRDWVELGCKQVSLFGADRDTIRVGRREGRFSAIRLRVRGADVQMLDLKVVYANGAPDDIRVRSLIRQGGRTRRLDLRGRERSIRRVTLTYVTIPNFKGLANVCVEGLQ